MLINHFINKGIFQFILVLSFFLLLICFIPTGRLLILKGNPSIKSNENTQKYTELSTLLQLKISQDTFIRISFTHSVNKTLVQENFTSEGNLINGYHFISLGGVYQSLGAGMDSIIRENEEFHITDSGLEISREEIMQELNYTVGSVSQTQLSFFAGEDNLNHNKPYKTIYLTDLAPSYTPIKLRLNRNFLYNDICTLMKSLKN